MAHPKVQSGRRTIWHRLWFRFWSGLSRDTQLRAIRLIGIVAVLMLMSVLVLANR